MSLVETDQIDGKVQMIMRQTDYNEEKAIEKLKEFNFNELSVIKDYMGIPEKKQQNKKIVSVNQAIYKQLRTHLDTAMSNYRERVDKGEVKKVV